MAFTATRAPLLARWCVLAGVALAAILSAGIGNGGDTRLPTAAEIADLQKRFQAERETLVKSGSAKRFLPNLLVNADAIASRGEVAVKAGRLLQAAEAFRQARWQLPYQGPNFPDHVARVFGNLRLRHGNEILATAFSPDGKWLATGSRDNTVKIWDMANGHEAVVYRGHQRYVRAIAFAPDGKWVASAGGDKDIRIWQPQTGKEIRTLKGTGNYTTAMVISPDGKYVFAAGDERTLRIYDVESGEIKRTVEDFGMFGGLRSLAFSLNGKRLATGAENGQIRLWAYPEILAPNNPEYFAHQDNEGSSNFLVYIPNGQLLVRGGPDALKFYAVPEPNSPPAVGGGLRKAFSPPVDPANKDKQLRFTCAVPSKDGKTLFTGCTDGVIRLIDLESFQYTGTYKGHNGEITALAFNAQGTQLASASTDYTVRMWDFDIVIQALEFAGHTEPIWAADFSPDGQRIVSCGADRTLRSWDVGSGRVLRTYGENPAGLTAARFAPDGKTILSGGGDKLLRLHDAESGKVLQIFQGHTGTVTAAAFNRDGSAIVSGGADKSVIVWSTATGKALATVGAGSLLMAVAFTPDNKQVVAGTADGHVRFFDAASGKPGPSWVAHNAAIGGLSFDARGELLATSGFDNLVKVWRMSKPGQLAGPPLAGHTGPVSAVAFRPDGKYLVSAGSDHLVKLWKNDNGAFKESQVFRGHKDWVTALAFNSNGFQVLSAGADRTIKVWEVASRELPLTSEHTGAVECVAVSADAKLMASGGTDKTIKIWDLKTGMETVTIRGHGDAVLALAFSPDGKTLFSSGGDRNIRRWNTANGQPLPALANQENITNFINPLPQLAVRPDGKRLIAWVPFDERGTRIALFDTANGAEVLQLNDRGKHILAVAWTRDFKQAALGAKDGSLRLYDLQQEKADKKPVELQAVADAAITSLAFSGDGQTLHIGTDKGEVLTVDSATQKERLKLPAHAQRVTAIAASPDGSRLATVGMDNIVKLWDANTGKELRRWAMPGVLRERTGLVTQLLFTPDGRSLVTANANTTLFMLECP